MKTLLAILAFCSSAHAKAPTEAESQLAIACIAIYHHKENVGPCAEIIERSKHHLVSEADYISWCGATMKYKKEAEEAAAAYQKLTKKVMHQSDCPENMRN